MFITLQHSTVQYSPAQYSAVQYTTSIQYWQCQLLVNVINPWTFSNHAQVGPHLWQGRRLCGRVIYDLSGVWSRTLGPFNCDWLLVVWWYRVTTRTDLASGRHAITFYQSECRPCKFMRQSHQHCVTISSCYSAICLTLIWSRGRHTLVF